MRRLPALVPASTLPDQVADRPVLGIADDTLEPTGFAPTGALLVAGPSGSGRTTTIKALGLALHRWDPTIPLFHINARRGPNAAAPWWTGQAIGTDQAMELVHQLTTTFALQNADTTDDRPGAVLFVESLTDLLGTPVEQPLAALVKAARRNGHLVVAESETSTWGSAWPLVSEIRNNRRGLLLAPDQNDGDALFRVALGRVARAQFPPGRGMYVETGVAQRVQIPLPDRS